MFESVDVTWPLGFETIVLCISLTRYVIFYYFTSVACDIPGLRDEKLIEYISLARSPFLSSRYIYLSRFSSNNR